MFSDIKNVLLLVVEVFYFIFSLYIFISVYYLCRCFTGSGCKRLDYSPGSWFSRCSPSGVWRQRSLRGHPEGNRLLDSRLITLINNCILDPDDSHRAGYRRRLKCTTKQNEQKFIYSLDFYMLWRTHVWLCLQISPPSKWNRFYFRSLNTVTCFKVSSLIKYGIILPSLIIFFACNILIYSTVLLNSDWSGLE